MKYHRGSPMLGLRHRPFYAEIVASESNNGLKEYLDSLGIVYTISDNYEPGLYTIYNKEDLDLLCLVSESVPHYQCKKDFSIFTNA